MDDSPTGAAQGGGAAIDAIASDLDYLGAALKTWEARSEDKPCPNARRAANDAMDLIDDALAALHALRQRLVSEIRASDDANAKRVDELLAKGWPGTS